MTRNFNPRYTVILLDSRTQIQNANYRISRAFAPIIPHGAPVKPDNLANRREFPRLYRIGQEVEGPVHLI